MLKRKTKKYIYLRLKNLFFLFKFFLFYTNLQKIKIFFKCNETTFLKKKNHFPTFKNTIKFLVMLLIQNNEFLRKNHAYKTCEGYTSEKIYLTFIAKRTNIFTLH